MMTSVIDSWGSPPRYVPFTVKIRAVTCGIAAVLILWTLLGIALMAIWQAGWYSELFHPSKLVSAPLRHTLGVLTDIEPSVHSGADSDEFEYRYQYQLDGTTYRGISYGLQPSYQEGDTVKVYYVLSQPVESKAEGLRTQPIPATIGLLCFLPSGAIVAFILFLASSGLEEIRLLETGVVTACKLLSEKVTPKDEYEEYTQVFQFTTLANRGHRFTSSSAIRYEDGVLILYDPKNPRVRAFLVDFDGKITISQGQIAPFNLTKTWICLLYPLLVVGSHILYLVLRFTAS